MHAAMSSQAPTTIPLISYQQHLRLRLRLFCLLLLLLLLLLVSPHACDGYSLLPTPSSPPVAIQSPRSPVTNRTRFAYVGMHYEGTPRDDEYLLGLRTLIFSLQSSGTQQDIVVLLSDNVRQSTRQQLQAANVILHTVPNLPNPFKASDSPSRRRTYKPRFEFTFNKLYLWSLTQYERVVYLDSDNVVLSNADELFLCGKFCVVFMNPLLFHTGLMVIAPDTDTFTQLQRRLFSDDSYSHDGADQGFLCAVFDMEDAPLFNAALSKPGVPSPLPRHRLPIGYNLNQFWYYTYFSWDFFRRNAYYWREYAVPGLSLAFPSNWWMKPWYWYNEVYLHHQWTWQIIRYRMDGYGDWAKTVLARLLLAAVVNAATAWAVPTLLSGRWCDGCSRLVRWLVSFSPAYIGNAVGIAAFFTAAVSAFRLIPMVAPTALAYPLFVVLHFSLLSLLYSVWCQLLRQRGAGVGSSSVGYEESRRWLPNNGLMLLMHLLTFWLFHPYFLHFIIKLAALIWTAMLWLGVDAFVFRRAAERMLPVKQA